MEELVDAVRTEGSSERDLSIRSREFNSIGEEDFSDRMCFVEIFTFWDICVMRCDFLRLFSDRFSGCFRVLRVIFFEITR